MVTSDNFATLVQTLDKDVLDQIASGIFEKDFIAFESLTEADVLGWVHAEVSKEDTEASIQAQLDEMATPSTVTGMPWVAEA